MHERARLDRMIGDVRPPSGARRDQVQRHLDDLTKPQGSLGRLEDIALRLALIYGDPPPRLERRVVCVLAGDHGVACRGVSAYPPEVTAQMCANYAAGGAAINAIARSVGAEVIVADFGVNGTLPHNLGVLDRKIRPGTRDLSTEAALTDSEVIAAITAGAALVDEMQPAPDVVALGEMGIGNSTAASAMTVALTGIPWHTAVGRGTGVSGEQFEAKRRAVRTAVGRLGGETDPLRVLCEVGGLEIAGLVGVTLAMARQGRAVVTDGFIATTAVLAAVRLCPQAIDYVFASHCSTEPGHARLLDALSLSPALDLEMRLGEGTGAVLALPVLDAAAALLRDMATFGAAGVARQLGV